MTNEGKEDGKKDAREGADAGRWREGVGGELRREMLRVGGA